LLSLDAVEVRFGGLVALDRVSLTVMSASIAGVIGPNGAGKSTLMNAVSGFVKLRRGRITFDGVDLARIKPHQRARLGLGRTFQVPRLYRGLTVRENIDVVQQQVARHRRLRAADDVLAACGVGALGDRRVESLDAGAQRFVEIARTLATAPSLVLLDEPATGLRDSEIEHLGRLLLAMRDEHDVAILVISHDMRVIHQVCDTVTMLDFGAVVTHGPPTTVCSDPQVIAAYLGQPVDRVPAGDPDAPLVRG
jgi:ABC-type branched-subunit amino acid transport system ATPase component